MSQLFTLGGQSIGASASVLPKRIWGWFPLRLTGFELLGTTGALKSLLQNHSSKTSVLQHSAFFIVCPALTCVHDYWKEHSLDYTDLCQQSDVFAFNTLSRFVRAFLPRSHRLLISWLQSPSTVTLEPRKRKSVTASTFSPSICHVSDGTRCHDITFLVLSFKPAFSLSSFTPIRGSLVPLHFLPLEWYRSHIGGCWYFSQQS